MKISSSWLLMGVGWIVSLNIIPNFSCHWSQGCINEVIPKVRCRRYFFQQIRYLWIKVLDVQLFLGCRGSTNSDVNLPEAFVGTTQKDSVNEDHPDLSRSQFSIEASESVNDFILWELRENVDYLLRNCGWFFVIQKVDELFIVSLGKRVETKEGQLLIWRLFFRVWVGCIKHYTLN